MKQHFLKCVTIYSLIDTRETAVTLGDAQQFTKYTSQAELEDMHINTNGFPLQSCECELYLRVSFRNEVYHSTSYTRSSMQISYTVMCTTVKTVISLER